MVPNVRAFLMLGILTWGQKPYKNKGESMISNVREGDLLDSQRVAAKWPAASERNEMPKHEHR